jgi:hypothetical protein
MVMPPDGARAMCEYRDTLEFDLLSLHELELDYEILIGSWYQCQKRGFKHATAVIGGVLVALDEKITELRPDPYEHDEGLRWLAALPGSWLCVECGETGWPDD